LFKPSFFKTRLTVAGETPTSLAICLPVQRWRRSSAKRRRWWRCRAPNTLYRSVIRLGRDMFLSLKNFRLWKPEVSGYRAAPRLSYFAPAGNPVP